MLCLAAHTGVVAFDNGADIFHATTADLHRIAIKNFMQLAASWEMQVEEFQECTPYIHFYIFVIWWVEPCDPPRAISRPFRHGRRTGVVHQLLSISAGFKRTIVCWCGVVKGIHVAGNFSQPSANRRWQIPQNRWWMVRRPMDI